MRAEVSIRCIAAGMDRSPSTVTRELGRNASQRGYRHKQAEGNACHQKESSHYQVALFTGSSQADVFLVHEYIFVFFPREWAFN